MYPLRHEICHFEPCWAVKSGVSLSALILQIAAVIFSYCDIVLPFFTGPVLSWSDLSQTRFPESPLPANCRKAGIQGTRAAGRPEGLLPFQTAKGFRSKVSRERGPIHLSLDMHEIEPTLLTPAWADHERVPGMNRNTSATLARTGVKYIPQRVTHTILRAAHIGCKAFWCPDSLGLHPVSEVSLMRLVYRY